MPYRGKPSAGCSNCRKRKIKCDLRPGGCARCEKSGWKCEGYRDVDSLMFHDESETVKSRHVKATQKRKGAERDQPKAVILRAAAAPRSLVKRSESPAIWSKDVSPDTDSSSAVSPLPISDLLLNLDDIALGFFFDKYVLRQKESRGLVNIEDSNGCLYNSVLAVGLAGATRHNAVGQIETHPGARKHYLRAIQQTNEALRSSEGTIKDSTLQAINILAIFEIMSCYERSLDAWREHIKGAAALLHIRGPGQFKTFTGCRLFIQTTANLYVACLAQRLPLPPHILDLMETATRFIPDPSDSVWRFHSTAMRTVNFHSSLGPGSYPRSPALARAALIEALALFAEFNDILATAPDEWRPSIVSETGLMIYSDYYYVFPTSLVTQMFCAICSYKLILVDIMSKALDSAIVADPDFHLESHQQEAFQEAFASTKDTQLAILACIPQHFHDRSQLKRPTEQERHYEPDSLWGGFSSKDYIPFKNAPRLDKDLPFVRMSGGYMVQFPLYTAGAADPPGGPIRSWVVGMLRLLGEMIGIQQAFVLANQLEDVNIESLFAG